MIFNQTNKRSRTHKHADGGKQTPPGDYITELLYSIKIL